MEILLFTFPRDKGSMQMMFCNLQDLNLYVGRDKIPSCKQEGQTYVVVEMQETSSLIRRSTERETTIVQQLIPYAVAGDGQIVVASKMALDFEFQIAMVQIEEVWDQWIMHHIILRHPTLEFAQTLVFDNFSVDLDPSAASIFLPSQKIFVRPFPADRPVAEDSLHPILASCLVSRRWDVFVALVEGFGPKFSPFLLHLIVSFIRTDGLQSCAYGLQRLLNHFLYREAGTDVWELLLHLDPQNVQSTGALIIEALVRPPVPRNRFPESSSPRPYINPYTISRAVVFFRRNNLPYLDLLNEVVFLGAPVDRLAGLVHRVTCCTLCPQFWRFRPVNSSHAPFNVSTCHLQIEAFLTSLRLDVLHLKNQRFRSGRQPQDERHLRPAIRFLTASLPHLLPRRVVLLLLLVQAHPTPHSRLNQLPSEILQDIIYDVFASRKDSALWETKALEPLKEVLRQLK
jgi:hypothetical protein